MELLSWLVPGVVGGKRGVDHLTIRAVLEHEPRMELVLAARLELAAAHPDLAAVQAHRDAGTLRPSGSGVPGKVLRVVSEQTWLPRLAHAVAPDVVHHAGGVLPLVHRGATVLTIHDLQPLDLPGNFPVAKRWYLRAMLGRSARAADVVCVPSDFTAGRASERLGVDRDAIRVVPWTVVSRRLREHRGRSGHLVR
ncbi:MAG: glycosyltransferase [Microthrixaceae bacterium]